MKKISKYAMMFAAALTLTFSMMKLPLTIQFSYFSPIRRSSFSQCAATDNMLRRTSYNSTKYGGVKRISKRYFNNIICADKP